MGSEFSRMNCTHMSQSVSTQQRPGGPPPAAGRLGSSGAPQWCRSKPFLSGHGLRTGASIRVKTIKTTRQVWTAEKWVLSSAFTRVYGIFSAGCSAIKCTTPSRFNIWSVRSKQSFDVTAQSGQMHKPSTMADRWGLLHPFWGVLAAGKYT